VADVPGRTKIREVADDLRARILSGELAPGDLVPSEPELMQQYGYSRDTVRKAVAILLNEGLITNGQGRPRRVRKHAPLEMPFAQSESRERAASRRNRGADAWVTDVAEQGRMADTELTVSIISAEPRIAAHLELEQGEPVVVRRHVRLVDGEPHNLSDTFYDPRLAEGTPIMYPRDIPRGVILYMQDEMGIVQDNFLYEFEARMPTPDEAQRLRIPAGVPVMIQYTTGYEGERPVKVTVTTWPADRARLIARLPG
jgi:GntR family transcriptional regulator